MKKVLFVPVLLAAFLFLFKVDAKAATSFIIPAMSQDVNFIVPNRWGYDYSGGYTYLDTVTGIEGVRTITFSQSFNLDVEGTIDPSRMFVFHLTSFPQISLTKLGGDGMSGVQDVRVYLLFNGRKYYFSGPWQIALVQGGSNSGILFVEADIWYSAPNSFSDEEYPASKLYYDIRADMSSFGFVCENYTDSEYGFLQSIDNKFDLTLSGLRDSIVSVVTSGFNTVVSFLQSIDNKFNLTLSGLRDSIVSVVTSGFNTVVSFLQSIDNKFNLTLSDFRDSIVNKLSEITAVLTSGFDNSGMSGSNMELSGSISSLEGSQEQTFSSASADLDGYDVSAPLQFGAGLVSGLSLVTTFANGFFGASGELSVAVSVLFCLGFLCVVIGMWRFR